MATTDDSIDYGQGHDLAVSRLRDTGLGAAIEREETEEEDKSTQCS